MACYIHLAKIFLENKQEEDLFILGNPSEAVIVEKREHLSGVNPSYQLITTN